MTPVRALLTAAFAARIVVGMSVSLAAIARAAVSRSQAEGRSNAGFFLSAAAHAPDTAAARTLLAMDLNHDGMVDPSEVKAFALAENLDAASATQEFAGLDLDGDGNLDARELAQALDPEEPAAPVAAQHQKPAAAVVEEPEDPVAADAHMDDLVAAAAARSAAYASALAPVADTSLVVAPSAAVPRAIGGLSVLTPAAVAPPRRASPAAGTYEADALVASAASHARALEPLLSASLAATSATGKLSRAAAAAEIVKELAVEESEQLAAESLDSQAAGLRANATALATFTAKRGMELGATAARAKAQELLASITALEDRATDAEVEAGQLRAKSRADQLQADELMETADAGIDGQTAKKTAL